MSIVATETIHGHSLPSTRTGRSHSQGQGHRQNNEKYKDVHNGDLSRSASTTHLSNIKGRENTNHSQSGIHGSPKLLCHVAEAAAQSDYTISATLRNERSSIDSSITAASTVPTTPGPRNSVFSSVSQSLSRDSPVGSAPSTPSRSPSPPRRKSSSRRRNFLINDQNSSTSTSLERQVSFPKRKDSLKKPNVVRTETERSQSSDDQSEPKKPSKSGLLRKKSARSINGLFKNSVSDNEAPKSPQTKRPAVPPLPTSYSTDTLSTIWSPPLPSDRTIPRLPNERAAGRTLVIPKKKDELSSVFRNLEAEHTKFTSKSGASKASVVRSALLPFLRDYAKHPSNRNLRPEDLDRRANILNKWWTGLIEMIHGRNNQSFFGQDRHAILDGISGIMERPEWRSSPSPLCPLKDRSHPTFSPPNRSTTSLTSTSSDFLAESVYHNVRNIFIQNLSSQMAFVVEKMSSRNTPASLVTFCGKACAYAFMFVPGMADVLVRLWEPHVEPVRRVLEGNGIGRFEDVSFVASTITAEFPPSLQQLGFTSLTKYMRSLRKPPPLPPGTSNIPWWGHWLERWTGRESDLFYGFVKHYHVLVTGFLPSDATKQERMCAPGLLLVHAQILRNLDATIRKNSEASQQDPSSGGPSPTFDDVLVDPDAVASTLPVLPTNAKRIMTENRLIMLVRDFLSERTTDHPLARQVFAESFSNLLETATRGISLFDRASCCTLLDFLEEALVLLVRFERLQEEKGTLIDFDFWKIVWRKMITSQNTTTEIRLYSFLYTVWNTVVCDSDRKADVCFDLLLDPDIFEGRFSHWCAMVRAYFMRLLCWRVARHDGDYSDVDVYILETLVERLGTVWSHYLFRRGMAELEKTAPPPTNPSSPTCGRRLLIVRTDTPADPNRTLFSLGGMLAQQNPSSPSMLTRSRSSTLSEAEADSRPNSPLSKSDSEAEKRGRGIGEFFRNLVGAKSRSKSITSALSKTQPDSSPVPELPSGLLRAATDNLSMQSSATSNLPTKPAQPIHHQQMFFKFSLEPYAKPHPHMRLSPPRLPLPAHQFLMTHSQKSNSLGNVTATEPTGESKNVAKYCSQALAEWFLVLVECQSFFERRRSEGIPCNKHVETPTLGMESLGRGG